MKSLFIVLVILMLGTVACTSNDDAVNALHQEIGAMQQQIDSVKQEIKALEADHAKQVSANANKITALESDNAELESSLEKLGTRDSRLSTQISNLETGLSETFVNHAELEECLVELFSTYETFENEVRKSDHLGTTFPYVTQVLNSGRGPQLSTYLVDLDDYSWSQDQFHMHSVVILNDKFPPKCKS